METNFTEHSLEAIETLLKLGGHLSVPYKQRLLDWYVNGGMCLGFDGNKYLVGPSGGPKEKFEDLALALQRFEHFLHPKNNVGVALQLVLEDHKIDDELDNPPVAKRVRSLLRQKKYRW